MARQKNSVLDDIKANLRNISKRQQLHTYSFDSIINSINSCSNGNQKEEALNLLISRFKQHVWEADGAVASCVQVLLALEDENLKQEAILQLFHYCFSDLRRDIKKFQSVLQAIARLNDDLPVKQAAYQQVIAYFTAPPHLQRLIDDDFGRVEAAFNICKQAFPNLKQHEEIAILLMNHMSARVRKFVRGGHQQMLGCFELWPTVLQPHEQVPPRRDLPPLEEGVESRYGQARMQLFTSIVNELRRHRKKYINDPLQVSALRRPVVKIATLEAAVQEIFFEDVRDRPEYYFCAPLNSSNIQLVGSMIHHGFGDDSRSGIFESSSPESTASQDGETGVFHEPSGSSSAQSSPRGSVGASSSSSTDEYPHSSHMQSFLAKFFSSHVTLFLDDIRNLSVRENDATHKIKIKDFIEAIDTLRRQFTNRNAVTILERGVVNYLIKNMPAIINRNQGKILALFDLLQHDPALLAVENRARIEMAFAQYIATHPKDILGMQLANFKEIYDKFSSNDAKKYLREQLIEHILSGEQVFRRRLLHRWMRTPQDAMFLLTMNISFPNSMRISDLILNFCRNRAGMDFSVALLNTPGTLIKTLHMANAISPFHRERWISYIVQGDVNRLIQLLAILQGAPQSQNEPVYKHIPPAIDEALSDYTLRNFDRLFNQNNPMALMRAPNLIEMFRSSRAFSKALMGKVTGLIKSFQAGASSGINRIFRDSQLGYPFISQLLKALQGLDGFHSEVQNLLTMVFSTHPQDHLGYCGLIGGDPDSSVISDAQEAIQRVKILVAQLDLLPAAHAAYQQRVYMIGELLESTWWCNTEADIQACVTFLSQRQEFFVRNPQSIAERILNRLSARVPFDLATQSWEKLLGYLPRNPEWSAIVINKSKETFKRQLSPLKRDRSLGSSKQTLMCSQQILALVCADQHPYGGELPEALISVFNFYLRATQELGRSQDDAEKLSQQCTCLMDGNIDAVLNWFKIFALSKDRVLSPRYLKELDFSFSVLQCFAREKISLLTRESTPEKIEALSRYLAIDANAENGSRSRQGSRRNSFLSQPLPVMAAAASSTSLAGSQEETTSPGTPQAPPTAPPCPPVIIAAPAPQ